METNTFTNIFSLFEFAVSQKLKYPKIHIQAANGQPVRLQRAGDKSKYTGQIMLTDGERFGSNKYFGRIDQNGKLIPSRELIPVVEQVLVRLAADPVGVAKELGQLTGNCIFCQKHLDDTRSTANGYGPVCAKKFNLPWDAGKESRQASKAVKASLDAVVNAEETLADAQDDTSVLQGTPEIAQLRENVLRAKTAHKDTLASLLASNSDADYRDRD